MAYDEKATQDAVTKWQEKKAALESEIETPETEETAGTEEKDETVVSKEAIDKETPAKEPEQKEVKADAKVDVKIDDKTDATKQQAEKETAYVPNKSYSVRGKKFEFDPIFEPILKNKETEEKLRQLHVKADGVEAMQLQRDNIKKEYETINQEYSKVLPIKDLYERARTFLEKGDMDNGVKCLAASVYTAFTEEEIEAVYLLTHPEKSEDKAKVVGEMNQLRNSIDTERGYSKANEEILQKEGELINRELGFFMEQPNVKAVSEYYDKTLGRSGAFLDKVIAHGINKSKELRKSCSVSEAISDMIKEVSPFIPKNNVETPPQKKDTSPQGNVKDKIAAPQKDVDKIPDMKSTGSVSRQSKPKSIAELRKAREALEASDE